MTSLKALSALALGSVLAILGFAGPAHAATVTGLTVTSAGAVSGATNPNPIVVNATFPTGSAAKAIQVELPTGWSWVTTMAYSSWPGTPGAVTSVTGYTPSVTGDLASGGPLSVSNALLWLNSSTQMTANTTVTITLGAGTVNVGSGTEFIVSSVTGQNPNSAIDQSSVYLNGVGPTPTPTQTSATPTPTQSSASASPTSTGSALPDTGINNGAMVAMGVGGLAVGVVILALVPVMRRRKNS